VPYLLWENVITSLTNIITKQTSDTLVTNTTNIDIQCHMITSGIGHEG